MKNLQIIRTILASSLILSLVTNNIYNDIYPKEYFDKIGFLGLNNFPIKINYFLLFDYEYLWIAKLLAILLLLLVVSGIFPIITGLILVWISFSFANSSIVIEGGDQMNQIISLLILPWTFMSKNINLWNTKFIEINYSSFNYFLSTIAFYLIRLQIFVMYFIAFAAKLLVPEWTNGTAMYFWINNNLFGPNYFINTIFQGILRNDIFTFALTYSTIFIEMFLAYCFFEKNKKILKIAFYVGTIFHLFIALVFGLFTFSISIIAGLIIYSLVNWKYQIKDLVWKPGIVKLNS